MLESRGKILSIMEACGIVVTSNKSVNLCKAQFRRKYGKNKRSKEIRVDTML